MLLDENLFKSIPKRKLKEKKWEHKIDKDLAFRLRDILEDDDTDYEALRKVMKDIYDNIHRLIPDMFDENECESAKEDLDMLDTEEEDGFYDPDDEEYDFVDTVEDSWNYELSNLYDICDTFNIWIPIRSLDESVAKKKKVARKAIKEDYDDDDEDEYYDSLSPEIFRPLCTSEDEELCEEACEIIYDWYSNEGTFDDFDSVSDLVDYVESDIYDMLDAATSAREKKIVQAALGYTDEEDEEDDLDESYDEEELDDIRYGVYDVVYDIVADSLDNLALAVHASIPKYNPAWCADDILVGSHRHIEDFVDNLVDDLFYRADTDKVHESYDKDGNHETCEECGALLTDAGECPKCDLGDERMNEKLQLNGGNQHIDSVGQIVYNEVKKIDPNVEVVTGDHTKVGVFTRNSNQVEQLKEAAIKAMAKHHYKPEVIKFKQLQNNYSGYVFDQISGGQVEVEPLRMREAFVTKDMPDLIKAAKAAGLTTLSELDAFIKEHEGEDIMKALADKKKKVVESYDDSDKDEYLRTTAQDTYESGQPYSSDDFDLFCRIGKEDGFELTQNDFDKYFEYLDEVSSNINESNSITNELPESVDQFLMDIAQTTNAFDYNDVSKFAKRATEEDIKKLKNIRRKWLRDAEMMEDDEVEAFGKKVASIIK